MNWENLATYLNDHLAGSVAALELLDHLIEVTKECAQAPFYRGLRDDVAADQEVLKTFLADLSAPESTTRKAGAWLIEKVARLKLRVDGPAGSAMGQMEALEALLLGITGKRALWRALRAAAQPVGDVDLALLERRAEEQIAAVEAKRVEAARTALGGGE